MGQFAFPFTLFNKRYFATILWLLFLSAWLSTAVSASEVPAPNDSLATPELHRLTILYTNDEHGWLLPTMAADGAQVGGVAEIMARWKTVEDYDPADDSFLLLSGGDNWTGPAISSFFQGEPAFEVMQMMGYDASAVGNHEFDFGMDMLQERMQQSAFPYLAANICLAGSDSLAPGFQPYTILEANDVRVGIIGLAYRRTPQTADPQVVGRFEFRPYDEALRHWVPVVEEAGADMIIALGHACEWELRELAPVAAELGVDVLTGGHCDEFVARMAYGVHILIGGGYWKSYARLDLFVDTANDQVYQAISKLVTNADRDVSGLAPDSTLAAYVAPWQERVAAALDREIGYTQTGISRPWPLYNLIADAWRAQYPQADVSFGNTGGVRQDIAPGPITIQDIYSVLPFENLLVDVELTGAQLAANIQLHPGYYSGLRVDSDGQIWHGEALLDPERAYRVILSDFMYNGGDGYIFSEQNPDGYHTGVNWRQPVIDYIRSLQTSPERPLEEVLDVEPRHVW